ncbi:MAG: hypothetical protein FWE24_10525 [Defluviitaleaceae bacterium]|nr:hypothetical protein [Defluviitaleaceae bacterium]
MDDKKYWDDPVNNLGRFTVFIGLLLCFAPFLYLVLMYDVMPPWEAVLMGFLGVASAFGVVWFVEPVAFFPVLGTAGTYMSFLAGAIGQQRIPAAQIAKNVAGVPENSREAELVAICGIAGSVFFNVSLMTIAAVAGTFILAILPDIVMNAITTYILPVIFGAVLAMFAKGRMKLLAPILAIAVIVQFANTQNLIPEMLTRFIMLFCVIVGVGVARFMYVKGMVK